MIFIENNTTSIDLFIEKHQVVDSSVSFKLKRSIETVDSSFVVDSSIVEVREHYYKYVLDCSTLNAGQYSYQIADTSTSEIYESGLLYKLSDVSTNNQNSNNIVYER